ncbi:MMPL family transporter [Streptomyces sp. NBS 14/10]|uniref:MMPL family transporter n=1 Tax=Streptomyces sp. NBS 14/10 TaxID=1945643 RepID=UPI000B7D3DBA|nr:MMPL family transporter [Streptomyces sp. NBS 14/10]KAK1178731.1 MMPL family transporter [Streptomyces sp. NBS 14/10]
MTERFVAFIGRVRWPLLAVWGALLVISGLLALSLPDKLSGGGWYVPGSQSTWVAEQQKEGFTGRGQTSVTVVVHDKRHATGTDAFERRVRQAMADIEGDKRLKAASHYGWTTLQGAPKNAFVGRDGHTAIEMFGLDVDDGTARRILPDIQREFDKRYEARGLTVGMVGTAPFFGEINVLSEEGLVKAEIIVMPLITLILLLLFRSVVSAVVAMITAGTAAVVTFAILSVLADSYDLSVFVQNTATMLGLGVGIDYSMFMIRRFRDELEGGEPVPRALRIALATSGETVVASGVTVIVSMATLAFVNLPVIQSIALGAALVVAVSVLTSVLLLPVLLYAVGPRIGRWDLFAKLRPASATADPRERGWYRFAHWVLRRPVLSLLAGTALLAVGAVPALALDTFTPDAKITPTSSTVRQSYDRVEEQFGPGDASPMVVLIRSDTPLRGEGGRIAELRDELAGLGHVRRVDSALDALEQAAPGRPFDALEPAVRDRLPDPVRASVGYFVSKDRTKFIAQVIPEEHASSSETRGLLADVRRVAARADGDGLRIEIGGQTAEGVDANEVISDGLPTVVGVMLLAIFVILMLSFRSVLLPLKAILVNVFSVSVAFGMLALAFKEDSPVAEALGFDASGRVTNFVPVLLLALLFSLSTDYEVFVLGRVREYYKAGLGNTESVALGISATGPLITGAAVLMVAVFGGFTLSGIQPIGELGFGMAVAIAVDATLVRMFVVPAAMKLMGSANWWFPGRGRASSAATSAADNSRTSKTRSTQDHGSERHLAELSADRRPEVPPGP